MERGERDRSVPVVNRLLARPRPWRCCISDGANRAALDTIAFAAAKAADLIQVRAKEMDAGRLLEFCFAARAACQGTGALLLVNDRLDVALAAGFDGVQLPAAGMPVGRVREQAGAEFLVGQSCHSAAEVAQSQADFALLGPIFPTPSKLAFGPALGLAALRQAAECAVPVLAVGGVTNGNAAACIGAGAAGVAAIRAWQTGNFFSRQPVE